MKAAYFDTSYLAKLHWREDGSPEVVTLTEQLTHIYCSVHGRAEFAAVGYRKLREGSASIELVQDIHRQIQQDMAAGGIAWLDLTPGVFARVEYFFTHDHGAVPLRAADALHLACAAEHGFTEVYSHDRHFLAAAPAFGLRAHDVIPRT